MAYPAFAEDSTLPYQLSQNLARLSSQQQQHEQHQHQQQQPPQADYSAYQQQQQQHQHQQQQQQGQTPGGFGGVDEDELFRSWSQFNVAGPSGSAGVASSSANGVSGAGHESTDGGSGAGRTSLKVPFFRWFGPTAYTPGIKRYKVELREDEDDVPATTTNSPPLPSSHLPRLPGTSPSFGPPRPGTAPGGGFHQPSGSGGPPAYSPSSAHSHSSPEGDASHHSSSPEDLRRAEARAVKLALFKTGRERMFPRDHVLERHLDVFFDTLGGHFPFLSKESILQQHYAGSLSGLLQNAICALAARFVPPAAGSGPVGGPAHPTPGGSHASTSSSGPGERQPYQAALPFEEQAKKLLVEVLSFPSVETAMSLVILAWGEFGSGRDSGLWMFSGMAIRIVQDLGLQHEASPFHNPSPLERARRRLVFWSVFFLDRVISYGTGRSVTIPEEEIDIAEPSEADCALFLPRQGAATRPPNPFPALIAITRHRGRISDLLNKAGGPSGTPGSTGSGGGSGGWVRQRREQMERLQEDMIGFYQGMHKDLHFSVQSFKVYKEVGWSPPFLMLHMLFHSVITVLHRPSLLQNFEAGEQVLVEPNVEVSRSSARTLSNMVSYADLVGPIALLANPFADQAIFISAIAFLDERTSLNHSSAQRRALNGLGMSSADGTGTGGGDGLKTPTSQRLLKSFADSKLDVSISALQNIISHWAGVGWVLRTINQKKRGFSLDEMDPDLDADTPSVLIPKDPTMVKAWIAREWRNGKTDGAALEGASSAVAGAAGLPDLPEGWSAEGWDENMLALFPSDIGISFTGQNLDSSHLNLVFEPVSQHYPDFALAGGDPTGAVGGQPYTGMDLDFAMDSSDFPSPSFFRDVVYGGGGGFGDGTDFAGGG